MQILFVNPLAQLPTHLIKLQMAPHSTFWQLLLALIFASLCLHLKTLLNEGRLQGVEGCAEKKQVFGKFYVLVCLVYLQDEFVLKECACSQARMLTVFLAGRINRIVHIKERIEKTQEVRTSS